MSHNALVLICDKSSSVKDAQKNVIHISQSNLDRIPGPEKLVIINHFLFAAEASAATDDSTVRLNSQQRVVIGAELTTKLNLKFVTSDLDVASDVTMEMSFRSRAKNRKIDFEADKLRQTWKSTMGRVPFNLGQQYVFTFGEEELLCQVTELKCCNIDKDGERVPVEKSISGMFAVNMTQITFRKAAGSLMNIEDDEIGGSGNSFFQPDFNFEELEIGGLDTEFSTLFRRAFNSRLFPPKFIRERGIKHVKGILLYGPPGTGKTLMARQIGKMLKTVEPKIVNGPEVLNKFVGESEKNIRELFADARKDQDENKDNSQLHLIIFDEIDSICKKRGSVQGASGVADTVVNQLLSMIDGVDALDNVLLIGMTNRKDLIDEALMRPGRLEVQIEIGLPNKEGRVQIFNIHTKKLRQVNGLTSDVNIEELAEKSPNYTGAEIEGVVKSAQSCALNNGIDPTTMKPKPDADLRITREHFMFALQEVHPAFGVEENVLERFVPRGLVDYSDEFIEVRQSVARFLSGLDSEEGSGLQAFFVQGRPASGLTSFAVMMASQKFGYLKVVTAKQFIGRSEDGVCSDIRQIFEDAYKSRESAIILDDLDAIIEFSPIGPRFSNKILQACLVLIKSRPPAGHKLAVFVTSCVPGQLDMIGVTQRYFYKTIELGCLTKVKELQAIAQGSCHVNLTVQSEEESLASDWMKSHTVPVKRAIEALDIVKHESGGEAISWSMLVNELDQHLAKDDGR